MNKFSRFIPFLKSYDEGNRYYDNALASHLPSLLYFAKKLRLGAAGATDIYYKYDDLATTLERKDITAYNKIRKIGQVSLRMLVEILEEEHFETKCHAISIVWIFLEIAKETQDNLFMQMALTLKPQVEAVIENKKASET